MVVNRCVHGFFLSRALFIIILFCSTNRDLSPKGSGINQAMYKAVPDLEALTAEQFTAPARVGIPMLIELPENNSWRLKEGVRAIVHVLGPNS